MNKIQRATKKKQILTVVQENCKSCQAFRRNTYFTQFLKFTNNILAMIVWDSTFSFLARPKALGISIFCGSLSFKRFISYLNWYLEQLSCDKHLILMFLKAIIYTSASSTDVLLKTFPSRTVFMKRFKFFLQNTANFWSLHVFTKY